jgi:polar amino acid transport system permease protein
MVSIRRNKTTSDFFGFFIESFPSLIEGLKLTLFLTFLSLTIGFALGLLLALGRIYGKKPITWICIGYIEIIRGTPLLVQLFIFYYGLSSIGLNLSPLNAAILGLSLNSGAYQAEYLRSSIQSIPTGQMIAARTLGMNSIKSIGNIILPQALRLSIPAWSNELIYLLKYSSLAYIIRVVELTAAGKFIAAETFRHIEVFAIIAIMYLILTTIFTEILDRFENKISIPGLGVPKKTAQRVH